MHQEVATGCRGKSRGSYGNRHERYWIALGASVVSTPIGGGSLALLCTADLFTFNAHPLGSSIDVLDFNFFQFNCSESESKIDS